MNDIDIQRQNEVRTSADGWGTGLYSRDDRYRYWFRTYVDSSIRGTESIASAHRLGLPITDDATLIWIGLNPSRSDDNGSNRTTLLNVLHWADRDGFKSVLGVNLYSFRHTDPKQLRAGLKETDLQTVIGPHNDRILKHLVSSPGRVFTAWGSNGLHGSRGSNLLASFGETWRIGSCQNGEPLHPARKSRNLQMAPFDGHIAG